MPYEMWLIQARFLLIAITTTVLSPSSEALECYACNTGVARDENCDSKPTLISTTKSSCENDVFAFLNDLNASTSAYCTRIYNSSSAAGVNLTSPKGRQDQVMNTTENNTDRNLPQELCYTYSSVLYTNCRNGPHRQCRPKSGDALVDRGCFTGMDYHIKVVLKGAFDLPVNHNTEIINQCVFLHQCYEKERQLLQRQVCLCTTDRCNIEVNTLLLKGAQKKCKFWDSSAESIIYFRRGRHEKYLQFFMVLAVFFVVKYTS